MKVRLTRRYKAGSLQGVGFKPVALVRIPCRSSFKIDHYDSLDTRENSLCSGGWVAQGGYFILPSVAVVRITRYAIVRNLLSPA